MGSLTRSTYACVSLCQYGIAPGEFYLSNVLHQYQFVGLNNSTHVSLWPFIDQYILKQHASHAWYGCWTISVLVEAIAAPLINHSQTFKVSWYLWK